VVAQVRIDQLGRTPPSAMARQQGVVAERDRRPLPIARWRLAFGDGSTVEIQREDHEEEGSR
jgi:hypothetical protein